MCRGHLVGAWENAECRAGSRGCSVSTCPVTERACYDESIWLEHRFFLGQRSDMDDIAEAIAKVAEGAAKLA